MKYSSVHSVLVVLIALGILYGLSRVDWSTHTGNRIKNFDLFEDLFPNAESQVASEPIADQPALDPELLALEDEATLDSITTPDLPLLADSLSEIQLFVGPLLMEDSIDKADNETSFAVLDEAIRALAPKEVEAAPMLEDGTIGIENYSVGEPLQMFHEALRHARFRPVRIAVLGDSFIEGDLLTQNLRDQLQEIYGGRGVGYMSMHSDMPGFRQTVHQGGKGWKMKTVRDMRGSDTIRVLSGEYGRAEGLATATYKGARFSPRTKAWSRTSFVFLSPAAGSVSISGSEGEVASLDVSPSPAPQILTLDAETTSATISSDVPGLIGLGAYLIDPAGIQLDCMSIRGYSGISHRNLNIGLSAAMDSVMPYDLIIIEYGINALSAQQTNYTTYQKALVASIERIKASYPNADILVLGISDRGVKRGGEFHSMLTCAAMTNAQRKAASITGVHFWDMRAAMGGEDAVVEWRNKKLVNADYIHLNHKGGAEMASRLLNAILATYNE